MSEAPQSSPISSSNSVSGTPAVPADAHLQNLAGLHRMSRTAGLGSTDYAEVNVPAVMTIIIGAASVLALITPIFLFIPVVGVVIGIIALRQLRRSNGTQTGMTIALIGLLACMGFSAVTGYKEISYWNRVKSDERQLVALSEKFGQLLSQSKLDEAYALFDPRLAERVPKSRFEQFVVGQYTPAFGKITGLKSTGIFQIEESTDDTGFRMAAGIGLISADKLAPEQTLRTDFVYRWTGESWKIFNLPSWFPQEKGQPQAPPQSSSGEPLPAGPQGPPAP